MFILCNPVAEFGDKMNWYTITTGCILKSPDNCLFSTQADLIRLTFAISGLAPINYIIIEIVIGKHFT